MAADLLALGLYLSLVILLLLGAIIGRRVGSWQIRHDPDHKLNVVSVAEGGVFALLGLLIALTFTGAYERFEAQKVHVIDEANAIDTAYSRFSLLAPANRGDLRNLFTQYVDAEVAIFSDVLNANETTQKINYAKTLQTKIMNAVVIACNAQHDGYVTQLIIPAVNNMFESANTRLELSKIHPPVAIYAFLVGLTVLSAFLAGFSTAKKSGHSAIHILCYILITALTLYLIMDLEFPRVGLIRVDGFDKVLMDTKDHFD